MTHSLEPPLILDDRPYNLQPLSSDFGAEVRGISLKDISKGRNDSVIEQIIQDLRKYRALVVRDQVCQNNL